MQNEYNPVVSKLKNITPQKLFVKGITENKVRKEQAIVS